MFLLRDEEQGKQSMRQQYTYQIGQLIRKVIWSSFLSGHFKQNHPKIKLIIY